MRTAASSIKHTFDSLRITISRSLQADGQFQLSVERSGMRSIHGLLRIHPELHARSVHDLRRRYEQELTMMRNLAAAGMPVPSLDETPILDLGRQVAATLPPNARNEIIQAARQSRQRRRSLRLTIEVTSDTRELLSIPWELIALPLGWGTPDGGADASFLFLNAEMSIVRQVRGIGYAIPLELHHPLNVQAFAASPAYVSPIDTTSTLEAINPEQSLFTTPANWYDGRDTLGILHQRLQEFNPQVVHLLCHGEQSRTGRRVSHYELLFTHTDGYTNRVSTFDIARGLALAPDLQLVIIQACHGGTTTANQAGEDEANRQITESIALGLIRAGVPAVVAMQGAVTQQGANSFVRACYATLAQTGNLDRAVAAGRLAMRAADGVVDWSLPVIYLGSAPSPQEPWHKRAARRLDELFSLRRVRQLQVPS